MSDIYNSKIAKLLKWLSRVPESHCFGITTGPETTRYSGSADQVSVRLRRHEDQHKRQYQAYGSRIRFWWADLIVGFGIWGVFLTGLFLLWFVLFCWGLSIASKELINY